MATAIELQLPWVVIGGKNVTYYLAISAVLLLAWLLKQRTSQSKVEAPFYKASRLKWAFSAESLILDSYKKVSLTLQVVQASFGSLLGICGGAATAAPVRTALCPSNMISVMYTNWWC